MINLDKLIGNDPDIEKEIYEDQLRHLNQGVLIFKDFIQKIGEGYSKEMISRKLIFSTKDRMGQFYKIRGLLVVDSFVCLFDNDLIRIDPYDNDYCQLFLIKKGSTRKKSELENFIFESREIKIKQYNDMKDYLKNLTIESFIQFNYVELFKEIGITDDFFDSINIENYQEKETLFNKKIKYIVCKESFFINLQDIYFYFKGLHYFKNQKVGFLNKDLVVLKNKWITKDQFKI